MMKAIKVVKKNYSLTELRLLKQTPPSVDHVRMIIDNEALVFSGRKIIAIYQKSDFDTNLTRQACLLLPFTNQSRANGLKSNAIILNASPRRGNLDNRCWLSKLKRSNPNVHIVFEQTALNLSRKYLKYFKRRFAAQIKATYSGARSVHEAYRIKGTPFTGGIVNKNSVLPYHFDQANTSDGISCMLILKHGVAGGELILPQLNIGFACQDNYMLLFDGKAYLHGVTPILKQSANSGYRFTIVNYNNSGMDLCLPPEEEELHYQSHLEKQSDKRYKKSNNESK